VNTCRKCWGPLPIAELVRVRRRPYHQACAPKPKVALVWQGPVRGNINL
jgi:hypothetical protein